MVYCWTKLRFSIKMVLLRTIIREMQFKSKIINDPSRVITLANFISLFRAFLAIPIIYSMVYPNWNWLTGVLILIAILSDALDGYFAREQKQLPFW
ncbi:MAG: hypothetical protein CM15mP44_8900 [Candidatus Neomarinimicrobiota bacterium]|nr:MAG: hypothetical protein CM15mP44_8900 [Candidatus Neomarinimicrobiota bacterium]